VARLIPVEEPGDPRLADYLSLRDVQLRKLVEADNGLFLAEGEKVVRRAVAAGYRVRSFMMTKRWLSGLADCLAAAPEAPCFVVTDEVAEAATGFHVHRGALASLERRPLPTLEAVIGPARRIVVLEDIVDHTNVGAVFRSAAALGMDAVVLSPRCADPLYRRSIKVAMGAVFSIPWTRMDDWYDAVGLLSGAGFTTVALTPDSDAVPIRDFARMQRGEKVAVIVGSEGPGLSPRWLSTADVRVRIEMAPGVDSLNVGAAAAIAFFALGGVDSAVTVT
jgi:tRNA G18 (ribose-2'-O)-methylase SpoU